MLPNPLEYLNSHRNRNWYLNVPMILAQKSTKLWLGKGPLFQSQNEKILEYFNQKIINDKWFEKFYTFGLQNSLIGKSYILLVKTINNNTTIRIPEPSFNSRVAKYNEEEQAAELWFLSEQSDSSTLTWVTMTDKKVTYETFKANDKKGQSILIGSVHSKIKPNQQPLHTYSIPNPFNYLPLVEVTNLPILKLYGNSSTLNVYPDCWPVWDLIDDLQHTIRQKRVERTLNVTKALGNFDNETVNEIIKKDGNLKDNPIKDLFINIGTAGYNKTGQGSLTVIQGDPKFSEYINDYQATIKQIFNGAGYDYDEYAGINYENKTKSLMNNKFDMETTETKLSHYGHYFYRIFDLMLISDGLWTGTGNRPYSFKFIPIAMVDQIVQNEWINSRLNNGTMKPTTAISEYDNVSEQQANKIFQEILKENEELQKYEAKIIQYQSSKEQNTSKELSGEL